MPVGAWEQGFASRTIIVYSGEKAKPELFSEEDLKKKPHVDLTYDLQTIGAMVGKFDFTPDAKKVIREWYMADAPPQPTHPKLSSYITRRVAHTLKLCQVACAARTNDLLITVEDYERAKGWLLHAEAVMPDAFKAMSKGGSHGAMEECWYMIYHAYMRQKVKAPIDEVRVWNYLSQKVPAEKIEVLLKTMRNNGLLRKELNGYVPVLKDIWIKE
jgi:hypothetical protein